MPAHLGKIAAHEDALRLHDACIRIVRYAIASSTCCSHQSVLHRRLYKARLAAVKLVEEELPKVEEKIKGLSGESATKAKEKFEQFKKLLQQFKLAAPDKWEALKEGLMKEYDELKKLVGLAKGS